MTIVRRDGYASIGSYGLLADGCGSALVAADGSIDWLAEPTVDAPPLLARLVDRGSGGHFVLRPSVDYEVERHYVGETMVLETNYQTASGTLRVTEALNQGTPGSPPWRELAR